MDVPPYFRKRPDFAGACLFLGKFFARGITRTCWSRVFRIIEIESHHRNRVGFAFTGQIPTCLMPQPSEFHEVIDREIPTTFVKMDLPIGYSISRAIPNIIPFVAITTVDDKYSKNYHRWQIPLEPVFASTTHKMQGATAKFGAAIEPSAKKSFARGLDYVATSRSTELAILTLLAPLTVNQFSAFPQKRHSIRQDYDRLRELHPSK